MQVYEISPQDAVQFDVRFIFFLEAFNTYTVFQFWALFKTTTLSISDATF